MIDQFIVFSKTGYVHWSKTFSPVKSDPVNTLINTVLLEDRTGDKVTNIGPYALKWTFDNKHDVIYCAVYQKLLQLLYVDNLLDAIKRDWAENHIDAMKEFDQVRYDDEFGKILRICEKNVVRKSVKAAKKPRGFVKAGEKKANASDAGNTDTDGDMDEFAELKMLRREGGKMRSMRKPKGKGGKKEKSGKGKKMTKWSDSKLSKDEIKALDRSATASAADVADAEDRKIEEMKNQYLGEDSDDAEWDSDYESDDGYEGDGSLESDSSAQYDSDASISSNKSNSNWAFGNTRIGSFFNTLSGNKILEREDLEDVVKNVREQLISKNVAPEVANEVTESVVTSLVGKRLEGFTRISTVVKEAIEDALERILTPKKSVDVLREILAARAQGRTYSIVFVGVNGVGKSTSLSKVTYYLKSKGIKVMIAACDTFRSGAVEQLNQHAKVLDVPLFQEGYAKDPAKVAKDGIAHAQEEGYDCLLIDTAGRMQNNEPLMRSLAKLVSVNNPDLVLFVGEALVGNDGIDQLSLFNRALVDYSPSSTPHTIDGIVLTKFDTIDDKVGAAVSMVYKTGQPVVFVGTGQKYTNLKKLNVRKVMRSLLD